MENVTGNNKYLKEINRALVLDLIRTHQTVSKARLAKITGLSPTAIGTITSSLLESGYIHETGTIDSERGRRAIQLELKSESYYSIGFDIDVDYLGMALIDITGKILYEKSTALLQGIHAKEVVERIEDEIQIIMNRFSISHKNLLGVGISIAGMVNHETEEIILAPNLGWSDVKLKTYIQRFTDISFFIENEAMSSAICENWIGSCRNVNDFVCINIKSGIGAGIFVSGKLYRGAGGCAGEIGHISVDENGPRCGCGNYGCLETMASTQYIVENAKKLVRQGVVSRLNEFRNLENINLESIIAAARTGDESAKGILIESARYLGIAISNIVNILNPTRIVLGKEFIKYSDLVLEYIKSFVSNKALKAPAANVEIINSVIGEKASTIGAAIIPLKVLFGK